MDRALRRAAVTLLLLAVAPPAARAVLPPRHGGVVTLPSPHPLGPVDPTTVETCFEATLVEAVFDGLYEIREDGRISAVLADGPPEVSGTTARIRLRRDVRLHFGGRPLAARHVVRSLLRASTAPRASWLLGAFATENGRPVIREVDEHTVEIELAGRGLRADLILAATPLRIVAGGNLRRRPLGTGPFRARADGAGGVELTIHRFAPDGAPWLDRIRFRPMLGRDDEIREYALGRLDGSWRGASLFGREPARPNVTRQATASAPWLLLPNRARALRDEAAWGGVVASIDRQRLARVGLEPRRSLSPGLPAPALPSGAPPSGTRLFMPVREGRPREVRAAEAIAGMLDERGIRLQVERLSASRYAAALRDGRWDLRLVRVRPPLPGRGPMAGAALAATGQVQRARDLVPTLGRAEVVNRVARRLDAMVLGHERVILHHRADLRGLRIDSLGRLTLADIARARPAEPFR